MSSDVCAACDTSIYTNFGADQDEQLGIDPSKAALWALLPGGGHIKAGQAPLGLAVSGLLLSTLVFGISMVSGSRRVFGLIFLASCAIIWAISIHDATRLAARDDDRVLLQPKIVTSAMGLVFALLVVAAVSFTGGEVAP